jgi:PAS domain-containing protein
MLSSKRLPLHSFLSSLSTSSPVVIISFDPKESGNTELYHVEYMNQAAELLFGASFDDFINAGRIPFDCTPEKMQQGGTHRVVCHNGSNGEDFHTSVSFSPFVDACFCIFEQRSANEAQCVDSNICESIMKTLSATAEDVSASFELLFNTTPVLMGVAELLEDEGDVLVVAANQALATLLGRDLKDIIGKKNYKELGGSREETITSIGVYKECMHSRKPLTRCDKATHPDGRTARG